MFVVYIILPESPAWCASRPNQEARGKRMLSRLNKGVKNYDVDTQWEVLVRAAAYERQTAVETKTEAWWNIFKGINGVRLLIHTCHVFSWR